MAEANELRPILTRRHRWAGFVLAVDLLRFALLPTGALDSFAGIATLAHRTPTVEVPGESRRAEHPTAGRLAAGFQDRAVHFVPVGSPASGQFNAIFVDAPAFGAVELVRTLDRFEVPESGAARYSHRVQQTVAQ